MLSLLLAQADTEVSVSTPEENIDLTIEQAKTTVGDALQGDTDAMWVLAQDYLLPVVWAIVILVIAMFVGKILASSVQRAMGKARVDETLARFFGKIVYYLMLILGVMFALGKFGIEVTSFAAILAAAGFAVGMALSGTLSNFAAGAMLLIFRPFKIGDVVSAAGITAKVHEIELFTTTFDTPDNRRIIVPNGEIYGGTIENITFHGERRVDVSVGADYGASIDDTRAALNKAADSLAAKRIDGEGRGHAVVLVDLGDSSVNWVVRFWAATADYWGVKEELTRAVKMHLDDAGIGIPFPQMDVHVNGKLGD